MLRPGLNLSKVPIRWIPYPIGKSRNLILHSHKKVAMARKIAESWLKEHSRVEYRVTAFPGPRGEIRNLPSLLRSWRDGKVRIASLTVIPDLGLKEGCESGFLEYWSSDADGIRSLTKWLEDRGYETTGGVW